LGKADRDNVLEPDRTESMGQASDRGLRPIAVVPGRLLVVIRDLDLGTGALDEHQATVADELAGVLALDGPETVTMVALHRHATRDAHAHRLDRRIGERRQVLANLRIAEHREHSLGVGGLERADDESRRLEAHRSKTLRSRRGRRRSVPRAAPRTNARRTASPT